VPAEVPDSEIFTLTEKILVLILGIGLWLFVEYPILSAIFMAVGLAEAEQLLLCCAAGLGLGWVEWDLARDYKRARMRQEVSRQAMTQTASQPQPQPYLCGNCHATLSYKQAYCSQCGTPVLWDGI